MPILDMLMDQRSGMVPPMQPTRPAPQAAPQQAPQAAAQPAPQEEPSFFQRVQNFFNDEEKVAKFVMALSPLGRAEQQANSPLVQNAQKLLEEKRALNLLNAQGNKTADALEAAGQKQLADMVRADPSLAKSALTALYRAPGSFDQKLSAIKAANPEMSDADVVKMALSSSGTTINMPSVGTIPPGYRAKYDDAGNVISMEPVPGGPVATEEQETGQTAESAYAAYQTGIDMMFKSFGQANTGSLAGLIPALTSADLTFEGLKDVMLQPLKSIFRGKGEGTFTDADAEQLLRILPTRRDDDKSAQAKIDAADMIIRAKLGLPLNTQQPATTSSGATKIFNPKTRKLEPVGGQ